MIGFKIGTSKKRGLDMDFMFKYPRTRHIEGSKKQVGDEDLDYISFKEIKGFYVVLFPYALNIILSISPFKISKK